MYSSDSSASSPEKKPEKRRSFLPAPKTYSSRIPAPSRSNVSPPLLETSPPKTQPIPIPQQSPPQNTIADQVEAQEFFIGDRVTIGGVKPGTLLYFGQIHVAEGVWCGIALDEAEGTHDGLVKDIRYFTCRKGHGIFAPVEKVSLLDNKTTQVLTQILKSPVKVSQVQTKSKGYQDIPVSDDSRSNDNSESCDQDSDAILNIDENGIIQDTEEEAEHYRREKKRRKLPKLPRPASHSHALAARLQFMRQEIANGNLNLIDEAVEKLKMMADEEADRFDTNKSFSLEDKYEELQHSAGGSSGNEDSWSLSKDYVAMTCDGKQYLNITFDGESESKTSTQEPSEESPSPEFIFDQEMIEDGEFSAQPMEMSRDSSLGLLSSMALDKNDLLLELVDGGIDDDVGLQTSQETLEANSDNKDFTPEKCENENTSIEFRESEIIGSSSFVENTNNERNNLNETHILDVENENTNNEQSKPGLNTTYTTKEQNAIIDSGTDANEANTGEEHDLNSTYTISETADVKNLVNRNLEVANKGQMVDSGISLKGSMIDSEIPLSAGRTSMTESSLKGSVTETLMKGRMMDSGMEGSVQGSMIDSAGIKGDVSKVLEKEDKDSGLVNVNEVICNRSTLTKDVYHADIDDKKLMNDLKDGHQRKERPISFLSTTSADTGYAPDTDSELGTLTLNSPQEWMDRGFHGNQDHTEGPPSHRTLIHDFHGEKMKLPTIPVESDSDLGTMNGDTDNETDRPEIVQPVQACETGLTGVVMENIAEAESEDEVTQIENEMNVTRTLEPSSNDTSGVDTGSDDKPSPKSSSKLVSPAADEGQKQGSNDSTETTESPLSVVTIIIADKEEKKVEDEKVIENIEKKKEKPQKPQKKKKFNVVKDFKKPNTTNVVSKLSEYLKAPLPVKAKEDKANTEEAKNKRNSLANNKIDLSKVTSKINNKSPNEEKNIDDHKNIAHEKKEIIEKEPVKKVKRTPPKSKWDAIMNQIDSSKDVKLKPKTEVKSKLEALIKTPIPVPVKKEEPKPKPKRRISNAIPDYSKVESKLKYTAPPVAPAKPKREETFSRQNSTTKQTRSKNASPASRSRHASANNQSPNGTRNHSPVQVRSTDVSPARGKLERGRKLSKDLANMSRERNLSGDSLKRPDIKDKMLHIDLADSLDGRGSRNGTGSLLSSRQASQTDVSTNEADDEDEGTILCRPTTKRISSLERESSLMSERRDSTSALSEISDAGSQARDGNTERKSSLGALSNGTDDQNRNKTKTKKDKPKPPETVLAEVHTREVHRLEALCEARTKQLNIAKMQLQTSNLAFDGMSIANKYLAHDCDGFSSPALKRENKRLKDEIEEHKATVRKRWEQKQEMEELLGKLKEEHKEYVKNLELENERTITYQRENMDADHNEELLKERESFRYQMNCMKHEHETHVSTMKIDHTAAIERLQMQRREEIKELQRRQENQMEELHKQHQDKLEDITGRFDGIKLNLLNKVESLKAECDGFRDRARACEEALQRDSDYKVQCALAPYKNLPQEIESLKTVIEMKNEEINKLRTKNIELTKKLEELPIAEEKVISLQQKKENLEAIISMKTDHEKVLHERCQSLMKKYDKESKANKRLSMDYEELMWKLSESFNEGSVDTGSQENLHCKKLGMSESAGSPDMGRRLRTPTGSEGSPSKSPAYRRTLSSSVDDREEKKFKRRSGNFLLDAGKQIRSTSPLAKQNPLTKSWCPGTESPSPTQSHRLSPNLMSQSWCVDMSENEQSASKLPKSRSSLEPDNEKPRSRRRLIKESDRPDSEIVSDDSLSNSVRSNGLEVSADSKAEAKEEVQVKGRVRKNTVTLDDSESVFSGKEDAQAVNTSSLQQNGHVLKSPEKPEAKSVKSSMSESSSSETVTLQRGAVMCPPSKLPTYQDRKTTRSHKESMV